MNKGQQFAAYEEMAKNKLNLKKKKQRNSLNIEKFSKIITQLDDLKRWIS